MSFYEIIIYTYGELLMLDHRTKTFMTVCNVMNYREAAELLHITQPAVTQHIQFLEKEYGCRLFLYENRKLIKTPAAQMLEDYLRSAQQRENFLREKFKNNGLRELRIGATKTIGDYVITDQIHKFLDQPDTALTLIVDNTRHLLQLLEQNALDYAIIEDISIKTDSEASSTAKNLSSASARKTTHLPEKKSP